MPFEDTIYSYTSIVQFGLAGWNNIPMIKESGRIEFLLEQNKTKTKTKIRHNGIKTENKTKIPPIVTMQG